MFREKYADLINEVSELYCRKTIFNEAYSVALGELLDAMEKENVCTADSEECNIRYVEKSEQKRFDVVRFRAENPQEAEKYTVISPRRAYLSVVLADNADKKNEE